jgi:hypothetical protein
MEKCPFIYEGAKNCLKSDCALWVESPKGLPDCAFKRMEKNLTKMTDWLYEIKQAKELK